MPERVPLPAETRRQVLAEAGYRCAVPTCRNILALDIHHIVEVSEGGSNDPPNLVALCGTCHDLYHRRIYTREAVRGWKGLLLSLNAAFDRETIDNLLFLRSLPPLQLGISGDGVLKFSSLIGSGMASFKLTMQNGPLLLYEVALTDKGRMLVEAWVKGDQATGDQTLGSGG